MSRFNVSDVNRTETNQFPLKWSAPESLSRFEYSEATDVWSCKQFFFKKELHFYFLKNKGE